METRIRIPRKLTWELILIRFRQSNLTNGFNRRIRKFSNTGSLSSNEAAHCHVRFSMASRLRPEMNAGVSKPVLKLSDSEGTSPATARKSVDLPQPEGPTRQHH